MTFQSAIDAFLQLCIELNDGQVDMDFDFNSRGKQQGFCSMIEGKNWNIKTEINNYSVHIKGGRR